MFNKGDICTIINNSKEFDPRLHYILGKQVLITGKKNLFNKYPVTLLFRVPENAEIVPKLIREDLLYKR